MPDQEPQTGGVALVEHHTLSIDGRPRYFTAAGGETLTHIAFTVAEAEALEAAVAAMYREDLDATIDALAVLAALRGAK